MNALLLIQVGLMGAFGVLALSSWRRGQRLTAIGLALVLASSLVRLWGGRVGAPGATWISLALLFGAVGFFWRGRTRAARPAALPHVGRP